MTVLPDISNTKPRLAVVLLYNQSSMGIARKVGYAHDLNLSDEDWEGHPSPQGP